MAEINLPELSAILTEIRPLRNQLTRIEAMIAEKEGKPYLTIQEVAAELKFSEGSVKSWCTKRYQGWVSEHAFMVKTGRWLCM